MLTRVLAVAAAILADVAIHFYSQNGQLRAQLADAQAARALARASRHRGIDGRAGHGDSARDPVARRVTIAADGLQRPEGLWINGHPDYEGISAWVFDEYLRHRLNGLTEAEAEAKRAGQRSKSDEWRAKHPPQG